MNIQTAKERVYAILKAYPLARNDDKVLTLYYWRDYQRELLTQDEAGHYHTSLLNILKLESEDKLSRLRRKIQNTEGRFLPTNKDVAIKRGISMEKWHAFGAQRNDTL